MSEIISPILTDATFASKMDTQNRLIAMLVEGQIAETHNFQEIHSVVAQGLAPQVFSIGDQINVPWSDGNGNNYTVPLDVVHFGDVELKDGEIVPGMWLQWHYATAVGIPFDANEAMMVCDGGLSAGTYYFTMAQSWGSKGSVVAGQNINFTLANAVPAGGHIVLTTGWVDQPLSNCKVMTYADGKTTTAIETVAVAEGATGTKLGDLSNQTKYDADALNNMQRCMYGYNRWTQSALRQYLNSSAGKNAWWTAQNKYDRIPTEAAANQGFMAGFSDEFKAIIKPVKVRTYLNTVSDSLITPQYEDTYDTWFPASLEQEFCVPQISGEGEAWEYWKQRVGHSAPTAQYATEAERIRYAINGKTSPQACRLRSASRGNSFSAWGVGTTGYVSGYGYAAYAYRCAPACVVC